MRQSALEAWRRRLAIAVGQVGYPRGNAHPMFRRGIDDSYRQHSCRGVADRQVRSAAVRRYGVGQLDVTKRCYAGQDRPKHRSADRQVNRVFPLAVRGAEPALTVLPGKLDVVSAAGSQKVVNQADNTPRWVQDDLLNRRRKS